MEIGEALSPAVAHTEPNDKCPFCPPPEPTKYKTYPGKENKSKILAAVMKSPNKLTSKQTNARPQTGKCDDDGYTQEQGPPDPRTVKSTWYTHQAHHLISGNQALKGSRIEDWILASDVNERDTGYSVNSTGNGFWAPSVPEDFKGRWSEEKGVLSDEERQAWANKVMKAANAQIHIGHHSITDPDDKDGDLHETYDSYIKKALEQLSDRIFSWSKECFQCSDRKKQNKKAQATYRVHDCLDRVSDHLERQVTGNRRSWEIFLSKYALNYHKPVCKHTKRKKL